MTDYLIVNAYSARNAGDAAIVLATASVLRADGESQRVQNATRYHLQDSAFYLSHGVEVVAPVIPFPPRRIGGSGGGRGLRFLAGVAGTFAILALDRLSARAARRALRHLPLPGMRAMLACDRVIVCGGGYLYSARKPLSLTLLSAVLTVKLTQLAGKRPLMMPQSIGPLPRRLDRRLVAWGYGRVTPIVVRDALALDEAREVMPRDHDVRVSPDVAFAGWTAVASPRPAQGDRPRVGIVTMDWTWARDVDPGPALEAYVAKLATVARALVDRGFEVRFYGHSLLPEMGQDDLEVARAVVAAVGDPHAFVDPLGASGDVDHLHSLFASLAVVIGTRLHSCIIAMSAGTPAIGLAYQPKTLGTYRLLGLEDLCLDVERFDPESVVRLAAEIADPRAPRRDVVTARVEATRLEVTGFYRELLGACAS